MILIQAYVVNVLKSFYFRFPYLLRSKAFQNNIIFNYFYLTSIHHIFNHEASMFSLRHIQNSFCFQGYYEFSDIKLSQLKPSQNLGVGQVMNERSLVCRHGKITKHKPKRDVGPSLSIVGMNILCGRKISPMR